MNMKGFFGKRKSQNKSFQVSFEDDLTMSTDLDKKQIMAHFKIKHAAKHLHMMQSPTVKTKNIETQN